MDHPHITPTSRRQWRAWLQKHHKSAQGVWLIYAKKHTGISSLTWQDGVEEALCFGWIDSLRRPVDDTYFTQLYTPRKPKSNWSAINKASVERLIASGHMTAAGLAAIEVARANGSWTALDHVESLTLPDDFRKALARDKAARDGFEALTPFVRKTFIYRLSGAKRPETRAKRIAELLEAAKRRHPPRLPPKPARPGR